MIAWVHGVPDEHWSRLAPEGQWQARDYISHLASIDPLLVGIMRSFQRENAPSTESERQVQRFSIDDWNEGEIMKRRGHSIDELINEMREQRSSLNDALAALTDEQLDRTFHFGGDKSRSPRDVKVANSLLALVHHDSWHMEDARRAIEGEPEQPFGDKAFNRMLGSEAQQAG